MIRPGRLDVVTSVAELDDSGVERLVRTVVPDSKLAADVDFAPILAAMTGFLPAFVREGVDRAKSMAIHRLGGAVNYVLSTGDLVTATLEALNSATVAGDGITMKVTTGDRNGQSEH